MAKTQRLFVKRGTRKNISRVPKTLDQFERQVVVRFLEILNLVKLYHWKTYSYATHKATDELYSKLNENIDHFIEVLLGKTEERTHITNHNSFKLIDVTSHENFKKEIVKFKGYLVALNDNKAMQQMTNTDLYNIRDEILGDLNQFLYLFTFK
jgi:hypothetical protein